LVHDIDLEAVQQSLFAHPGVKAVEDARLYRTVDGAGFSATITLAAADVDLATVQATAESILQAQFGIAEVDLRFKDPGPAPAQRSGSRGLLEKK
jgi:hypothetical protein